MKHIIAILVIGLATSLALPQQRNSRRRFQSFQSQPAQNQPTQNTFNQNTFSQTNQGSHRFQTGGQSQRLFTSQPPAAPEPVQQPAPQRFSSQQRFSSVPVAPQHSQPQSPQQPQQTFQAAPRPQSVRPGHDRDRFAQILRSELQAPLNGAFKFDLETDNGIQLSSSGNPGQFGQTNQEGSYSFILDDGTLAEVRYIADEFGFRAESPLIPTPPPLPAHALEQLRVAEEQRARGVVFQ